MPQKPSPPRLHRIAEGSFAAVVRAYQRSQDFAKLAPGSQKGYARILRWIEDPRALGAYSVYQIRPALVQAFLDGLADRPGAQKNTQSVLKAIEKFALVRDLLPGTVTTGTYTVPTDGGHQPWPDSWVTLAEQHARPDLARVVTLMVHTGQRGSDVVRMRWSDIEGQDGATGINVLTKKVGLRLWVPFTDELKGTLADWEKHPPFFLVVNPFDGKPYTRENLSWHWNKERDTNPALVPLKEGQATLHGLRATCVVRLRKRKASALQIANMIGMSEPMVARYSRFADQREMALAAVHHLNTGTPGERKRTKETKVGK
jgi:integrase